MDAVTYQAGLAPVNYVTGRYLAHNHLDRVSKAFLASDLISGSKQLVKPTILQAAMLAKVNSTYAWWATRQGSNRFEIERGYLPLVPPPVQAPISDPEIIDFVRRVGIGRVLDAAVEAAQ